MTFLRAFPVELSPFSVYCCFLVAQTCSTLCDPMYCRTPRLPVHHPITMSQNLFKLMTIKSVMPSNHLVLCRPLLLLPPIFPSIKVFSNESAFHIRWPKYWSFSFSNSLSNKYPGLISFMIEWFNLLAVQGTLKSLLQHHSSEASILQWAIFMVQISHPYMIIGKPLLWLDGSLLAN